MSNDMTTGNEILLIEIVSAWDLPCSDVRSRNDPYVSVVHHRRSTNRGGGVSPGDQGSDGSGSASAVHVHQTDHVSNADDPVWTIRSGSLFLLQLPRWVDGHRNEGDDRGAVANDNDDDDAVMDMNVDGELRFEVKDYDPLLAGGCDDLLGFTTVPVSVLRGGGGERREFALLAPTTPKRKLELKSETSETIADASTDEEEQAMALIGGSGDDDRAVKDGSTQRPQTSACGTLALRFRPATEGDAKFVQALRDGDDLYLRSSSSPDERSVSAAGTDASSSITNLLFRSSTKKGAVRVNETSGETEILVRPYPDPARPPSETEYLTEAQIETNTFHEPSRTWIEAANPPSDDMHRKQPLGKVHLEILGCDDLTDTDRSANILSSSRRAAEKTDAFVQIVYEDFAVRTDVVPDCLCPRWLPWTRRAVVLPLIRPSSPIFLAVLDHDDDNVVVSNHHDFIGRVTLNVGGGTFVPDTVYTLQYDLHTSNLVRVTADDEDKTRGGESRVRAKNGTITVRLRIELLPGTTERGFFTSSLRPPPTAWNLHIPTKKDRWAIKCAVEGGVDVNKFNLATTSSYVDELVAYKEVLAYVQDAAASVLFWRGHYRFHLWVPWCNCCGFHKEEGSSSSRPSSYVTDSRDGFFAEKGGERRGVLDRFRKKITFFLPLHSMGAFVSGVVLVERPHFFPSFVSALAAWVLLGVGGHRRNHPSPWERCPSYRELLLAFLWGRSCPRTVPPYENEKAIREHESLQRDQIDVTTAATKEAEAIENRRMEPEITEPEEQLGKTGDEATTNNANDGTGISINPLEPLLSPLQRALGSLCRALRLIRNVIVWDECFVTFWLTTACLAGAVIFAFVPWGLIVHWTARIIVWVFLGPWMWLVDRYYLRRTAPPVHVQRMQLQAEPDRPVRNQRSRTKADEARMAREDSLKLKDMKTYMFGEYFVKVPGFTFDRFRCTPCPASSAKPYDELVSANSSSWLTSENIIVLGQRLSGNMIPAIKFGVRKASVETQKCDGELTPLTSKGQVEAYSSIPKADPPSSDPELISKRERLKSRFVSKFSWIHGRE